MDPNNRLRPHFWVAAAIVLVPCFLWLLSKLIPWHASVETSSRSPATPEAVQASVSMVTPQETIAATTSALEAPGTKKITVASEIKRGCLEIGALGNANVTEVDFVALELKFREVLERNRRNNTDSDGFMLGARFGELLQFHARLNTSGIEQLSGPASVQYGRSFAHFCRSEITRLEQQFGFDDEALITTAPFQSRADAEPSARLALRSY